MEYNTQEEHLQRIPETVQLRTLADAIGRQLARISDLEGISAALNSSGSVELRLRSGGHRDILMSLAPPDPVRLEESPDAEL